MRRLKVLFSVVLVFFCAGCAIAPIRQEFNLPEQRVDIPLENSSQVKLVIYNDSNRFMYGIDGSGKINVTIDKKGAGRLSIGQFIVLALEKGRHTIQLCHKDMFTFKSSHLISVNNPINYLKIYSEATSNGIEIIKEKPKGFDKEFFAAY